jgi:hypothetical protein
VNGGGFTWIWWEEGREAREVDRWEKGEHLGI